MTLDTREEQPLIRLEKKQWLHDDDVCAELQRTWKEHNLGQRGKPLDGKNNAMRRMRLHLLKRKSCGGFNQALTIDLTRVLGLEEAYDLGKVSNQLWNSREGAGLYWGWRLP